MKLLLIVAAVFGFSVWARQADAADKAPKPSVCLSYQLFADKDGARFAVCHDSEKPALFSRFSEVVVPGKDGGAVKVLVGWR